MAASKQTFSVDFSDVNDEFEPLPAGVYEVEVAKAEVKPSKSSEYPYVNWQLVVTAGDYKNRTLFLMTSFSPKALFKLKETLIAFGEDPEAMSGQVEFDPESYLGIRVEASVSQEPYEGRMQNRVETISYLGKETRSVGRSAPAAAGGRRTLR